MEPPVHVVDGEDGMVSQGTSLRHSALTGEVLGVDVCGNAKSVSAPTNSESDEDPVSDADWESVADADTQEQILLQQLEEHQQKDNESLSWSDVMLKLLLMCGTPGIPAKNCACFTSLACGFICGLDAKDFGDGTSDAATVRDFLKHACNVLEAAINPAVGSKSNLNIAMTDMMRTANSCLLSNNIEMCKEYTRERRSDGYRRGKLWQMLRSPLITTQHNMAYATAEAMSKNFKNGLEMLRQLKELYEPDLLEFVNCAKPHLVTHLESMVLPVMFDGQRLYAGMTIAATLFGTGENRYGVEFMAQHVFNASASTISLFRIQMTFCSFLAMSSVATFTAKEDGWEEVIVIIENLVHRMDEHLKSKNSEECSRRDVPGSITEAFTCIADWFEMALHNDTMYRVLHYAFQAPVLVLGETNERTKTLWKEFCAANKVEKVNLWTAVHFLVTARDEMYSTSMPISTAIHIVVAGLVGNCVANEHIRGVFVLNGSCKHIASSFYKKLPDIKFELPDPRRTYKCPIRDGSRNCKQTAITERILREGSVRTKHPKGNLITTRLGASFCYLSMKEALMRDLKNGVSASPCEGRKDLRRIWIAYMMTLPCCKYSWCYHPDQGSYLIERKRSGDDGCTTKDNVEKPWRDILGGSLIATLYQPIAGEAFMLTLENIGEVNGNFKSNTNACVQLFVSKMHEVSNMIFNQKHALYGSPERIEGREYADRIFSQQLALVGAMCKILNMQTGCLWEALQLAFSMHATRYDDDDDTICSSSIAGSDVSSLPGQLPSATKQSGCRGISDAYTDCLASCAGDLGMCAHSSVAVDDSCVEKRKREDTCAETSCKQQKALLMDPDSPSLAYNVLQAD